MTTTLSTLHPDPASLPIGTSVGPWRVTGWRGRGAYGTVYRVEREDGAESGPFALKLANHSEDERFEREAALLSRIPHPHTPRLHGQGQWRHPCGVFPYLVMQWVEGVPLYEWAAQYNPTSRQVLRVLAQVARALEATHAAGGVHRDVKGGNVLVREEDGHAFLMDFGAGTFRGAATLTWQVLPPGTPAYRSPEAWAFQYVFWRHPTARYAASPCDDLFALGVTAYRLVTGVYPPPIQPGEEGAEVWRQDGPGPDFPAALNAQVCRELDALILVLLSVAPVERFKGSAREAALAFEKAAESAGPDADVALFSGEAMSVPEEYRPLQRAPSVELKRPETESPGSTGWRWAQDLDFTWGLGLVVAVLGLLLIQLSGDWVPAKHEEARADLEGSSSRDGGSSALGDEVSTAPVSTLASMHTTESVPGLGLPMPERPFPGQRRPPCDRNGEIEIRGGCWYELARAKQPCREDAYDWKEACYLPSFPPRRQPTSETP